jgi:hypothetical protein
MVVKKAARKKEETHTLWLVFPSDFWADLVIFFKERRAYNSYAEMCRHLLRLGLDSAKRAARDDRQSDSLV